MTALKDSPAGSPVESAVQATPARARRSRRVRPSVALALAVVGLLGLAVAAPQLLATHDPTAIDFSAALQAPSAEHWFGTDESGRDLYSRVVHGTRESLTIGLGAAALSLALALVLGALAALGGRFVSGTVNRLVEILFAFPTLLFALLLVAILGPSATTQIVAVGVGSAPGYARIVRGQILAARRSGYVEAAIALGHPRSVILRQHVIPNAVRPLVAVFTLCVGQSIVWASGLSFLGLGVAPPSSEWGALLDAGRAYVTHAPWLVVIPGLVIVTLALAATAIGKDIQARLESGDS
ncbi:MAG: ABC transporter permease [Actinomycetales bacterium]|nr:ABC transporter permease [Actinomycetales bacterium]